MMTATHDDTARASLERDITEALLRLRLARAERIDRVEIDAYQKQLDYLLDRLSAHTRVDEEMGL